MGGRVVWGFGATLVVVACAIACTQIAGIGDDPPTKLTCGSILGDGGCQSCGVSSCCLEMEACSKSASCQAIESCWTSCNSDAACRAKCAIDHPFSSDPALPALTACLTSHCDDTCGPACGWIADFVGPDAAVACQQCAIGKVCQPVDQCWSSPECATATYCLNASVTLDVFQACQAPFGDSGVFTSLSTQILSSCSTECLVQRDWSCVGRVTWPLAQADSISVSVRVADQIAQTIVPNVTIKACSVYDSNCMTPKDTQQTDSTGMTTLTLPVVGGRGSRGPTGYFDLQSDAGIFPEIFSWSFPLSEPTATFGIATATYGELALFAALLPSGLDDTRGHAVLYAVDCRSQSAADVQFTLDLADGNTSIFYSGSNGVSTTADRTSTGGFALAFNIPPGLATLTATPVGLGQPSSKVNFIVRPGTLTYVIAPPTP